MSVHMMSVSYFPSVDHPRYPVGVESARVCRECEVPLILVDGSPPAVKEGLQEAGGDLLTLVDEPAEHEGNLTAIRKYGFELLHDRLNKSDAGGWSEFEKPDTFRFAKYLSGPIESELAAAVIPERTPAGMQTLPAIQLLTEQAGNAIISEIACCSADWYHGPKFGDKRTIARHAAYAGTDTGGYGILIIPIMQTLADGLVVLSRSYDYRHHWLLTEEESRARNPELRYVKRPRQLHSISELVYNEGLRLELISKPAHATL